MRRAAIATVAPCCARARAVASPIPLEAPVTSATVPVSSVLVLMSTPLPAYAPAKAGRSGVAGSGLDGSPGGGSDTL